MKVHWKAVIMVVVGSLLGFGRAEATVSLNLEAGNLHGPTVGSLASVNSTAVILIDTDGDGFGDLTFTLDPDVALARFNPDLDDVVLGPFPVGLDQVGVLTGFAAFDFVDGISTDDDLLLVWYPSVTYSGGLIGPGKGQPFGTYRSDSVPTLPKISWNVPADGTFDLVLNTVDLGGPVPESSLLATQVTASAAANTAPVAVCSNLTVAAGAGCQAAVSATEFNGGSTDADGDSLNYTASPSSPYLVGQHAITLTVHDGRGGSNTCQATLTVVDQLAPTVTCPATITTNAAPGQTTVAVNYPLPILSDNCAITTTNLAPAPGFAFLVGSNTVTCTVVDASQNTNSCTFLIIVTAALNQNPVAVCTNLTVVAAGNCQAVVAPAQLNGGSSDPDGDPLSFSAAPASPYPLGTNNVTLTVADNHGGTNPCQAQVVVRDTTPPTVTCPGEILTNVAPGQTTILITYAASTATDACSGITTNYCTPPAGTAFGLGTNAVTCTAVDGAGNTNTCTFRVIVIEGAVPNRPPTAVCTNLTVSAQANCQAPVTAAQLDGGSSDPDGDPITLDAAPAAPYGLGTNAVTLTVADNRGGTNTCQALVIVRDTTAPAITCASDITTNAAPGQATVPVSFAPPTVSDLCSGLATNYCTPASGAAFGLGSNTVTCTVVDGAGNTNTCSFLIVVREANHPPVALCTNRVVVAGANCQATVTAAELDGGSTDQDGDPLTFTATPAAPYAVGTNAVTLTVADNQGGSNACQALVVVVDPTAPQIDCPPDILTNVAPGQTTVAVGFAELTAADACSGISTSFYSPAAGSVFPLGSNTVVGTAVDGAGNSNSCSFQVIVLAGPLPNHAPVAVCTNLTVAAGASCQATVLAAQLDGGSTDPEADPLSFSANPAGPYGLGNNTVTLTVADDQGGTNTCAALVIVVDTTLPTVTCPSNVVTSTAPGAATVAVNFPLPTANDGCSGIATNYTTPASDTSFGPGTNVVTATVVDGAGNTNTCSFAVIVTSPPLPAFDLAVVSIKPPKSIKLSARKTEITAAVKVALQNVGTTAIEVPDAAALLALVNLQAPALGGGCPALPVAVGAKTIAKLPLTLAPNKKLTAEFAVTFTTACVPDPLQTGKDVNHDDYRYVVSLSTDGETVNNGCPRGPAGDDPGCGGKNPDKTLGADVRTDVVVK